MIRTFSLLLLIIIDFNLFGQSVKPLQQKIDSIKSISNVLIQKETILEDEIKSKDSLINIVKQHQNSTENKNILELLQKIENKIEAQNLWSIFIPILVVMIGGIIALMQVKANLISEARIKWNEELRKSLSEYIGFLDIVVDKLEEIISLSKRNPDEAKKKFIIMVQEFRRLTEVEYQIKMLLNNKESSHINLQSSLETLQDEFNKYIKDNNHQIDVTNVQNTIASLSQIVLKESWESAKSINIREMFKIKW